MAACGSVLVADEDQAIVDFIVEALTDEGYSALGVSNSAAATAAILANPPDLVLIDYLFGTWKGMEVIRAIQASGVGIPMVIMTLSIWMEQGRKVQGAVAYLLKPFALDDLFACVANHIQTDD
jgi:DNA-binding NtrC family response regulator